METEKIETINSQTTDTEYIKIMKSETLKGIKYNWDFKILGNDVQRAIDLNNKLTEAFGGYNGE